jgi:coenzyme F420-dependent glucose-6-phosphate dehydrogenase
MAQHDRPLHDVTADATVREVVRVRTTETNGGDAHENFGRSGLGYRPVNDLDDPGSFQNRNVHEVGLPRLDRGITETMVTIGYALSSEEHPAPDLVAFAQRAEAVGFEYAMISDHFHPWIETQGQSPFVWGVLGSIAASTTRLRVGTGVTCPTFRYHPAIVAQAAATIATLMPDRFMLGVGTGEALNEHVVTSHWPPYRERAERLEEAIEIIRALWTGEKVRHHGTYYNVENAQLYSRPETPPSLVVAGGGPHAAQLAGRIGDALINFAPDASVVEQFEAAGGQGKPKYIQYNVCYDESEERARKIARAVCPTVALKGELGQLLPDPEHYEQAVELVTEDAIAEVIVCGPDRERHIDGLRKCIDAGFDHVHVDQVGPDQESFFRFYEREILPEFR